MGDRLTSGNEPDQAETLDGGKIFDELFPHYMVMGMTPEQYWDGENWLKPAFRKAYQLKMENEQKLADRQNWYLGQYIAKALQAVQQVVLVPGFNAKKNISMPDYPDKPFFETIEEQKKEEARKKKEEDQSKLAMAMFHAMAAQFNKNFEKKKQEQPEPVPTGQ